jgi:hypothetical protein
VSENRPDRIDNRQDNRSDRQDSISDNRYDRQDNVSDRRDDRQDNVSDRRDTRQENLSDNRADRIDNVGQRQEFRQDRRQEVRNQVTQHPIHRDFWNDGRYAARWTRPYRWATWGAIASWFPSWGATQPIAYNYGDNVYVEGDSVYYGDEVVASQQEYGEQAYTIASNAPEANADTTEWMPLGVFALTQDGEASGPTPNLYIQLAISKEGLLAGTYYNNSTDKSLDVEGAIDQKSQRSAWTVGGEDWPVMETGLSNLTKDEAPALIHFADGQTQQWLMIRLEAPEGEQSN